MTDDERDEDLDVVAHGMRFGARLILDQYAKADQWDLLPDLLVVAHGSPLAQEELPEELVASAPLSLRDELERGEAFMAGLRMAFGRFPISEPVWVSAPPAMVLAATAQAVRVDPPPLGLPDDARIVGLLFVSEVWGVNPRTASRPIDPDDGLADHPDRFEARIVAGVDTAGYTYSFIHERGTDEISEEVTSGAEGQKQIDGAIPEALHQLLDVLAEDVESEWAQESSS